MIVTNEDYTKAQAQLTALRDYRCGLASRAACYANPGSAWAVWYETEYLRLQKRKPSAGDLDRREARLIGMRRAKMGQSVVRL